MSKLSQLRLEQIILPIVGAVVGTILASWTVAAFKLGYLLSCYLE